MRRGGVLSALLLTAALLLAAPGLLSGLRPADENRMDVRLRPAQTRTMTLWLLSGSMGDEKLLSGLCTAFEKENPGLRVYLRRADPAELYAGEAVLPEAVLFTTGQVDSPQRVFAPLAGQEGLGPDALVAGQFAGLQYALPLWCAPNVLSLPTDWLSPQEEQLATERPASYFGLTTPTPSPRAETLSWATAPWRKLFADGALYVREGVCRQQLLTVCPNTLRPELAAVKTARSGQTPGIARAWSLREHLAAVDRGEKLEALPLLPAVSDQVRLIALPKASGDGLAFLKFLLRPELEPSVMEAACLPLSKRGDGPTPLLRELRTVYQSGFLFPNAFAYARQELEALCLDGWMRQAEPVETLLKLR